MELSSNTYNNNPSIQPIPKQDPTYSNKEVYEASQGNVVRNNSGELAVTPQGQTNLNNAQEAKATQTAEQVQASKDSQRDNATNILSTQSKKSQVEIYLSVASEGNDNPIENNTASIIESLRDVQKQNNAVEAYAAYKENQNTPANNLARGLVG